MNEIDAKSLAQLKELLAANALNKNLPIQLVNQFIDAAARIVLRQKMILSPVVKNCKRVSHFNQHFYDLTLSNDERVIWPGSTTILGIISKDWLIAMIRNLGVEEMDERLQRALDEGSDTHYVTHLADNGVVILFDHPAREAHDPELREQHRLCVEACKQIGVPYHTVTNQTVMEQCNRWDQVIEVMNPETLSNEMIVASAKYRYAGTLDRIWRVKAGTYPLNGSKDVVIPTDGVAVVDIKTGAEDSNYPKQLASYAEAFEESTLQNCDYAITVYLDAKQRGDYAGIKLVVASREEWKKDFGNFMHAHALWWEQNADKIPAVKKFRSVLYRPQTTVPVVPGIENGKAVPTEVMEKLNAIVSKSLTEDLQASLAQEEKRSESPKDEPSPKTVQTPKRAQKAASPAKAEVAKNGFFGDDTTKRYQN